MALKINLPIITIAVITFTICVNHVRASGEHCSADSIKKIAISSCSHLIDHISKREADLADSGYNVELVKARHNRHHHPHAKKITHSKLHGGYFLVHYPLARHIYSSNRNRFDSREDELNNELPNDILTQDLKRDHFRSSHHNGKSIKNKYNLKFKRNANFDDISYCCESSSQDACAEHFCN